MLGCILLSIAATPAIAQTSLSGFTKGEAFDEQIKTYNFDPDVRVLINAPAADQFDPDKPIRLIVFALPNGNTIEMTEGRKLTEGMDWHFDIQHIGAQIRRLREILPEYNWVVAYLEAGGLSWPRWRQTHDDAGSHLLRLLDDVRSQFGDRPLDVELTSHSGGGSLIFGIINQLDAIPDWINRIVFLDSNYGYSNEEPHTQKLLDWLKRDAQQNNRTGPRLCVIAYDDRNIELDGKRVIGPTGGTYRRTLEMVERFSRDVSLSEFNVDEYRRWRGLDNRLELIVLNNPENKILHTVMVERNGLIHALTFGTNDENRAGVFWAPRAYEKWIQE